MHSVEESLLHSDIQSEANPTMPKEEEAKVKGERQKERERIMRIVECIHSKKACVRAAIQLEAKPGLHQEEKEEAQERERESEQ
jgi:hypothetical protein